MYLLIRKNITQHNAVLLCGLSDSGKTLLFSQVSTIKLNPGFVTHATRIAFFYPFTTNLLPIFSQLAFGKGFDTHSSLKENISNCTFGKVSFLISGLETSAFSRLSFSNLNFQSPVSLVDIPGQERLRYQILERFRRFPR